MGQSQKQRQYPDSAPFSFHTDIQLSPSVVLHTGVANLQACFGTWGVHGVINMMDDLSAVYGRVPIPLWNVLLDICISDRPVSTQILHHYIYKYKVYLSNFIYIVLSNATITRIKGRNTSLPRIALLLGKSHHNGNPLQDICHLQHTVLGSICICGHHRDPMNRYIPYVSTLL